MCWETLEGYGEYGGGSGGICEDSSFFSIEL